MVEMVIIFKMVIIVEMVKMVDMVIMGVPHNKMSFFAFFKTE